MRKDYFLIAKLNASLASLIRDLNNKKLYVEDLDAEDVKRFFDIVEKYGLSKMIALIKANKPS